MRIEYYRKDSRVKITDSIINCGCSCGYGDCDCGCDCDVSDEFLKLECINDDYGVKLVGYKVYNSDGEIILSGMSHFYFIHYIPKPAGKKNAYIYFATEVRESVCKNNPHLKKNGTPSITSLIGDMWRNLQDKTKYIEQALDDSERYYTEIREWHQIYESGINISINQFLIGYGSDDEDKTLYKKIISVLDNKCVLEINRLVSVENTIYKKLIKTIIN